MIGRAWSGRESSQELIDSGMLYYVLCSLHSRAGNTLWTRHGMLATSLLCSIEQGGSCPRFGFFLVLLCSRDLASGVVLDGVLVFSDLFDRMCVIGRVQSDGKSSQEPVGWSRVGSTVRCGLWYT